MNDRRYTQLTATLDIAHQAGSLKDMRSVIAWVLGCLNCNTSHAEVQISMATPHLAWPDFLDAPSYGPDHPDFASDARVLNAVEHWLTLDRKALIQELIRLHGMAERGEKLPPADQAHEDMVREYVQAKYRAQHLDLAAAAELKTKDPARFNLMLAVAFDVDARPSSSVDANATGWFVSTPAYAELPQVTIPTANTHDQAVALAVELLGLESLFMARFSKTPNAAP